MSSGGIDYMIIISAILNFSIGSYSFYKLIRVLRNDQKKTLQALCYAILTIGLLGRGVCFSLVPSLFRSHYERLYATLIYTFSFMNTYVYILLIPLQAKLYYLCKDAEDLVLESNHRKKLVRIYILTTIFFFMFLTLVAFYLIFTKAMLNYFNAFHLAYFVVILFAMLYYGIKLVKTINRIGGNELAKQIKRIILVEIQWCVFYLILSLVRITMPELFDQYGILIKKKVWVFILLLLCSNFPALALLFVIFKTPNVTKNDNLLLNSYDSSYDEEKSY
ncbi:tobamovirus multiplication protein 1-like isoform x1 [Anaeramoeba flamelloides]|uniref:Tobamovirus multiplication protein 1-like isoform x1 n=1 Tax=Anaeramoeba flamelloides TaxID=1746091 RepID=A0AAV7Y686_9EUKA|nr:tobamovirus multiplication protein 1-like isoform x1 [Anaeramoeba flamelloides]